MSATLPREAMVLDLPQRLPQPSLALLASATLAAALLAAAAASLTVLPDPLESTLIAAQRGDYAPARRLLAEAAEAPAPPAGQVTRLVHLALAMGDTDRAAALLRRFLAEWPDHQPALRLQAEVLDQARRPAERASVLARLAVLTREAALWREVAALRARAGDPAGRAAALHELLGAGLAEDEEALELARAAAARGALEPAVALLLRQAERGTPPGLQLAAETGLLAAELPEAPALLERLAATLADEAGAGAAEQVAASLLALDRPRLALGWLRALSPALARRPQLALALAQAHAENGETEQALAALLAQHNAGTLPPRGLPLLAELALQRGDPATALAAIGAIAPAELPPWLPLQLHEALPPAERDAWLRRSDPAALAAQPTVILACDGCSDATAAIARATLAEPGCAHLDAEVRELTPNRGKVATLNATIASVDEPVVALTDVSAMLPPDALRRAAAHFAEPGLGAVGGTYRLAAEGADGETSYWAYQRAVKRGEAALGAPLGMHGAFWAFRRAAWQPLPADTINDDFIMPMAMYLRGWRLAYDSGIEVAEAEASDRGTEARRRRRIAAGNAQQLWRMAALLHPRHGGVALAFASGKALRVAMPLLLVLAFAGALTLAPGSTFFALLAAGEALGIALALCGLALGARAPKLLAAGGYALAGHASSGIGVVRHLLKPGRGPWQRA